MRSVRPVAATQKPSAPTAARHSAQPMPNAASCVPRRSVHPVCHSIGVSIRDLPQPTISGVATENVLDSCLSD
jgi:hypothetical protein